MDTELSDGRILIRPPSTDDIDVMYEAVRESIGEVAPWLPWCHPGYTRQETAAFILSCHEVQRALEEHSFVVLDAETNAFLGGVGLNHINRHFQMGNLGYWVRTSCARGGIASAATRLCARFGFQKLGLQRIEIVAAIANRASQRAAEKAGAVREGVLRKRLLINNQPHDAVLYSLVAEDLEEQR